jgi:hypothetical protein
MPYTPAQKKANEKWVNNHRDKYNELCRNGYKVYYEKNADKIRQKKLDHYYAKRELEIFRRILLELS